MRAGSTASPLEIDRDTGHAGPFHFLGSGTTAYGLDGIFFDQTPSRCGTGGAWLGLYVGIKSYVTRNHPGALVVANPGMAVDPCYAQAADIIVTFEGDYSTYLSWQPPDWEWKADSSRIWHLVYNARPSPTCRRRSP